MTEKTILTMREAADIAPVSIKTLYRMSKNGDISRKKCSDGRNGIDLSEMVRVFGENLKFSSIENQRESEPPHEKEIISLLEARITELEGMLDDMRHREAVYLVRERWLQSQVELNQKLLGSSKKAGVLQKIKELLK